MKEVGGTQNGVSSVSLSLAVFHDLFAKIERKGIKFRLRNRVRITHDNQLVAAVGGLIRRMDVRKGIGDIAAALVKALTADGCVIDKRIDFQNDRLVLPGQLGENQRAQTVTAKRRFDAEMLDRCMCRNPNRESGPQARRPAGTYQSDKGDRPSRRADPAGDAARERENWNDTGPKRPPSTGR